MITLILFELTKLSLIQNNLFLTLYEGNVSLIQRNYFLSVNKNTSFL